MQARGIAVYKHEQRVIGEHLGAGEHKVEYVVLYLPHLAARTAPVAGRVHDYRVVAVAAAYLLSYELETVVDYVAYAALHARKPCIATGALHHSLRSVHVGNQSAAFCAGYGCAARVCEEV